MWYEIRSRHALYIGGSFGFTAVVSRHSLEPIPPSGHSSGVGGYTRPYIIIQCRVIRIGTCRYNNITVAQNANGDGYGACGFVLVLMYRSCSRIFPLRGRRCRCYRGAIFRAGTSRASTSFILLCIIIIKWKVYNKWHLITTLAKSLNGRVVSQVLHFSRKREFSAEEKKSYKKSNPLPITVVPTIIYKISNIIHQHFNNFIFIVNSFWIIVVICRQVNRIYIKYVIILLLSYTRRRYPRANSKACAAVWTAGTPTNRRHSMISFTILLYYYNYYKAHTRLRVFEISDVILVGRKVGMCAPVLF